MMRLYQLLNKLSDIAEEAVGEELRPELNRSAAMNMKVGVSYRDPKTGQNILRDIKGASLAIYRDAEGDTAVTWIVLEER